jgi:hypothetical protein
MTPARSFRPTRRILLARSAGLAAALTAGGAVGTALGRAEPALAGTAMTLGGSTYLTPTGDTTGAADAATISQALSSFTEVVLQPGTFYINATITIPGNSTLRGCGTATSVQPAAGISGPMFVFAAGAFNMTARDFQVTGPSTITSSNPAADVFAPGASASRWWILNIDVNYCNGWVLNPAFAGAMHGVVQAVQGTNNSGGIRIVGTNSAGSTGQVTITNVNLQQCMSDAALYLSNVDDIIVNSLNVSIAGAIGKSAVHLAGGCQAIFMSAIDAGVFPGTATPGVPVLLLETTGTTGNTEVDISGSVFQSGGIGVEVTGNSARLRFHGVIAKRNLGDGWLFSGTGSAILVNGCQASGNNQSSGTAYDVHVTSTANVGLFAFAYCSSGVSNSLNVTSASNKVSNVNSTSPGRKTATGTTLNGW